MWIQFLIFYLLGLAFLIGGAIYYYFLIYEKPWNSINIWTKIGFFGLISLGLALIFIGGFYILYKWIISKRRIPNRLVSDSILSGNPPNRPGPEIFDYFTSQGLSEPLGSILQHLVLKLFEPDFNSEIVILDRKETEILKNKLEKFINFYRRNKDLIIEAYELRNKEPSYIMKYIFHIAPSNRIIAYFFKTVDNYIMVESPTSTRMSQDPEIRELCREYAQDMILKLKEIGFHKVPSDEVISLAESYYEYISDINRYVYPEVRSENPVSDIFIDPQTVVSRYN